jgi:hypothetical protein
MKDNQPFKLSTFRPDIYFWSSEIEKRTITLNLIEVKSPFGESKKDEVDINEYISTLDEVKHKAELKYNKLVVDLKDKIKTHINVNGSPYTVKIRDYQFVVGSLGCAHRDTFIELQNLLKCKNKQKTALYLKRMIMKAINGSYKIWCDWRYQKQKAWAIKRNLEQNYRKIDEIIEANYTISENEKEDLEKEALRQTVNDETGLGLEDDDEEVQDNIYTDINDPIYTFGDVTDLEDNIEDVEETFQEEEELDDTDPEIKNDEFTDEVEDDSYFANDSYSFDAIEFLNDIDRRQTIMDEERQFENQLSRRRTHSSEEGLQPKTPTSRVKSQRSFNRSDQSPRPGGSKSQLTES